MDSETPKAALRFLSGTSTNDLASMSNEDKRSRLIADLNLVSSHSLSELEVMPTTGTLGSLVGLASISGALLNRNVNTSDELLSMSYNDQRNTLIVFLASTPSTPSSLGE